MRRILQAAALLAVFSMILPAMAQSTPSQIRKKADASVDRNIMLSSAETVSKGDITINSYELVLLGLTYGISDDFQLSATTLLPITTDMPFVLGLSGKWQFVDTGKLLVSVQPNFIIGTKSGTTLGGFGAGIMADFLLDKEGKYVFTVGESNLVLFGELDGDSALSDGFAFSLSAAFSARVAKIVKLMVELTLPGAYNWDRGDLEIVEEGTMLSYGIRFFGQTIAVDLSFLRPIHPDADAGYFVMGFPYVTFSARF